MMDLQAIYKSGFNFIPAGVMVIDLQDSSVEQKDPDLDTEPPVRKELMSTLDNLVDRFSRSTVLVASGVQGGKAQLVNAAETFNAPIHKELGPFANSSGMSLSIKKPSMLG